MLIQNFILESSEYGIIKKILNMRLRFQYINILFLLLWLSVIGILLYREYIGGEIRRLTASEDIIKRTTFWYEIYRGERKIGFASRVLEKVGEDLIFKEESHIKQTDTSQTEITEIIKAVTDTSYLPRSFEYSLITGKERIDIKATIDREDIIFFVELPDKRFTKKLPVEGRRFYLPSTILPVIHNNIIQSMDSSTIQKAFALTTIDIKNLSFIDKRVVLEDMLPVKAGINVFTLFRYRIGGSIFYVNEKGISVKEEHQGIIFYISDEIRAKSFNIPRLIFDYTHLKPLRSETLISRPEDIELLEVQIEGFSPEPATYRDGLITINKDRLVIKKADIEEAGRTYQLPSNTPDLLVYTVPDKWVRSDYEDLKRTGRIYAFSTNNDARAFARYLTSYLFKLVSTQPEFVIPDSSVIVDYRRGDGIERSLLFASYSRAAGLPTRLMGGFVYRNGYFFFHVWPEIWLNGWIPVDPSMYQFPADATHIPLVTGDIERIISVFNSLEKVKIKILKAS
jgi:hypothetical protein